MNVHVADAEGWFVARARAGGVLVSATGPRMVRAVTHIDVGASDIEHAIDVLAAAAQS